MNIAIRAALMLATVGAPATPLAHEIDAPGSTRTNTYRGEVVLEERASYFARNGESQRTRRKRARQRHR